MKISFCTVSMNRLHHLKETLIKNIEDNKAYCDLEYVILDYNSSDNTELWLKEYCSNLIDKNIISYYKCTDFDYFRRSHSRNLAFKLAKGKVVCNIDADNFTGQGFADYLNENFSRQADIFISSGIKSSKSSPDTYGRICLQKRDFLKSRGFDELMDGYGFEDIDFIKRLEKIGLKRLSIENKSFLQAIYHSDVSRIENELLFKQLNEIYIKYIDHSSSEILFLFKDLVFHKGVILDNKTFQTSFPFLNTGTSRNTNEFSLANDEWAIGNWKIKNNMLELSIVSDGLKFKKHLNKLIRVNGPKETYYRLRNESMIGELLMLNSQLSNRRRMELNDISSHFPNEISFGKGEVYKNFDYNHIIKIE